MRSQIMQKLYKDIKGYEGLYQVSNLGNVKSIYKHRPDKILKPVMKKGYLMVTLCKNGTTKICSIHRLVAEAFIDNPDNLPVVNHKDGNRSNNKSDNLEWCTQKDNIRHAFNIGLVKRKPLTTEQKKNISIATKYVSCSVVRPSAFPTISGTITAPAYIARTC